MKKLIIIGAIVLAGVGVVYWLYKKGSTADSLATTAADATAFELDDTAAYNQMISIFKAKGNAPDLEWINKEVASAYTAGKYTIAGKASKAATWHILTYSMSANTTGTFTNKDSVKVLWDPALFDDTGAILNALTIKYTLL